jgi:hypothetical protein
VDHRNAGKRRWYRCPFQTWGSQTKRLIPSTEPISGADAITLLQDITANQTQIFRQVFNGTDPSTIPQVWALYKEVEGYYDQGLQVEDYVTLLWSDDKYVLYYPCGADLTLVAGGMCADTHFLRSAIGRVELAYIIMWALIVLFQVWVTDLTLHSGRLRETHAWKNCN